MIVMVMDFYDCNGCDYVDCDLHGDGVDSDDDGHIIDDIDWVDVNKRFC